jgi:hypothetical protein
VKRYKDSKKLEKSLGNNIRREFSTIYILQQSEGMMRHRMFKIVIKNTTILGCIGKCLNDLTLQSL